MYEPIPTWHQGRRYRSRLEVRWAVFFECLGYPYRYEPDIHAAVSYQPDFLLPLGVAVEIKYGARLPAMQDDLLEWEQFLDRLAQLERDHDRWQAFVNETGHELWVCVGQPVVWIEGQPARPAWALMYRKDRRRHLAVWQEGRMFGAEPTGTMVQWTIGPDMLRAAEAIRDYNFMDEAA